MKLYDVLSAIIEAKKKPAETQIEQDEKFKESLAAAKRVLGTSPKEKTYNQTVEALVTLYLTRVKRPQQIADRDAQASQVREYVKSQLQQGGVVPKESKKTGEKIGKKKKSTKTSQAVDTPADTTPQGTLTEPQPTDSAEPQAAEVPADVPLDTPSATEPAAENPAVTGTSVPIEPSGAEPESSKLSKPVTKKFNPQASDTPDTTPADATSSDVTAQDDVPPSSTTEPKSDDVEPATPDVKSTTTRSSNPRARRRPAGTTSVPVTTGTTAAAPADTTVPPAPSISTDTKDRLQTLAGVGDKPSPQPKPDPVSPNATVGSEPTTAPDTTQTDEPTPEIKPWTQAWVDMRRQQLAKMDPEQRLAAKDRAMRMVGHEPTDTPVDLVKGLKKYAQAQRGSMVQRTGGYRSMFREMKEYLEAQGLMHEELTLDEFMQLMTETTYGQTILNELEKEMKNELVKEATGMGKRKVTPDKFEDAPVKEPVRIPLSGRKGDGIGCGHHVNCRHNDAANDGEHSRTVKKKVRRREAKQQHPRNLDELSTDTLKKYIKAAANDASDRAFKSGIKYTKADEKHQTPELAVSDKENKRHKGIGRALKKLKETTITENTMENSYTLEEWMGMMQEAGIEEGRLSKLAAGLGLGAAALMGSPEKAQAQQVQQAPTTQVPNDSVQTATSRDMQFAFNKAGNELNRRRISQQGSRRNVVQNPDGTFTVTIDARKQPTPAGAPQIEEAYTIEEWVGMMQEAGIATEEVSLEDMLKHLRGQDKAGVQVPTSVRLQQILTPKKPAEPSKKMVKKEEVAEESYTLEEWMGMLEELGYSNVTHSSPEQNPEDAEPTDADVQASMQAIGAKPTQLPKMYHTEEEPVDTIMSRELRAQHPPVKIEETLNENAFAARMQVLAGILPQS